MRTRSGRTALTGLHGERYSAVYWAVAAAGFAFLVVDIFDDGAIWNVAVIVCVVIAIAVRPGGFRGRRATAPADEPASRGGR
jgi:hypothetical protein